MPQQFRAASPRTAAKKKFHWCFFPSCQPVLSDTLPRQQKSWIRTSHSALDTSSYKQTGFHRRHCLKTILIWMGQDSGVWKTILAKWAPFLLAPGRACCVLCYLWSPAASLSSQIIYPSIYYLLLLLAHSVLHLKFNISGQILLGQSTGEPWSTSSPFQECTVSYDHEEMVFKRKERSFPTIKNMNCEQELCSVHENCLKSKHTDNIYTIGIWQHFQTFFFNLFWHAIKE